MRTTLLAMLLVPSLALARGVDMDTVRTVADVSGTGLLGLGTCLKFQNGTWTQVCSPADQQTDVKDSTGAYIMRLYTGTSLGIASPNMSTDANGASFYAHPANLWGLAAAAKTPGSLVLSGALDSKTLVWDDADPKNGGHCPGTTTKVYACVVGTCAETTMTFNTICPGAGDCTTQASTCAAYKAWLNANLTGVTADCGTITSGAASALYLTANQPSTSMIRFTAETASCTTYSNGVDGQIQIPQGVYSAPGLVFQGDSIRGLYYCSGSICVVGSLVNDGTVQANTLVATDNVSGNPNTADIKNFDDWFDGSAMSTDSAATPNHVIGGKPPYNSPSAVQRTGGSIILAPGSGLRVLDSVTRAGTTGDTLTFTYCDMEGACASVVLTEGAGAGQWNCAAAASDPECVCNIYTLVTGHATLGSRVTVTRTDGTCSDEKLSFGVVPGVASLVYVTESDTSNEPVSDGTDGVVSINGGTAAGDNTCLNIGGAWFCSVAGRLDMGLAKFGNSLPLYSGGLVVQGGGNLQVLGVPSTGDATWFATSKGARTNSKFIFDTLTFGAGGEASKTSTGLIPLGAQNIAVTGRVIVANTGACSSFSVGNTGAADPDMYAATVPGTLAQTFGPTIAGYGPTAQPLGVQITADGDVVLTANGGNCANLSVRITVAYTLNVPDMNN